MSLMQPTTPLTIPFTKCSVLLVLLDLFSFSTEELDDDDDDENSEESVEEESEEDLTETPKTSSTQPPYSLIPPPPVWVQRNQGLSM